MTTGLDPKRIKNFGFDAPPPSEGFIGNKFDSNPDQGERYEWDPAIGPNKFPHQTGHTSITEEEAQFS